MDVEILGSAALRSLTNQEEALRMLTKKKQSSKLIAGNFLGWVSPCRISFSSTVANLGRWHLTFIQADVIGVHCMCLVEVKLCKVILYEQLDSRKNIYS